MAKTKIDKGSLPTVVETGNNPLAYKDEFDTICGIISAHKKRAMYAVHNESLNMLWEVGAYVSDRLKNAIWGDGVVRMLAEYIHTRSPKAKGWSYSTIYRMVRFSKCTRPIASFRLSTTMECKTICQTPKPIICHQTEAQLCQLNRHKFQ